MAERKSDTVFLVASRKKEQRMTATRDERREEKTRHKPRDGPSHTREKLAAETPRTGLLPVPVVTVVDSVEL